jgi:hypothetical protein
MATFFVDPIGQALADAGVISDINTVVRVVVDIRAGEPATVYVQRYGRPELADVLAKNLVGAEVVES